MPASPRIVARKREVDALALKVANPTMPWSQIGELVGLKSAGAAHDAAYRPLRRSIAENAPELRALKNAQLDTIFEAHFPFAVNDVETVLQWIGKGKEAKPDYCDDEPEDDDPTHVHRHQRCYVIPSQAMLGGAKVCTDVIKQQADLFGLKHSDGLAERKMALEEAQALAIFEFLTAALEGAHVDKETKDRVQLAAMNHMKQLAIDATAEDKTDA